MKKSIVISLISLLYYASFSQTTNLVLPVSTGNLSAISVSNNSKMVVSAQQNKLILWDIKTGKVLRTFEGSGNEVKKVSFSPDDKYILTGGSGWQDSLIILWDIQTGEKKQIFKGHSDAISYVGFTPDNKVISTSEDKTMKIWNIETGSCIQTATNDHYAKGYKFTYSIDFSPDGKHLLAPIGGGKILLLKYPELVVENVFESPHKIYDMTIRYIDYNSFITATSNCKIGYWSLNSGLIDSLNYNQKYMYKHTSFSKNNKYAVTTDWDYVEDVKSEYLIKIWDLKEKKLLNTINTSFTGDIYDIQISNDNKYIVACSYHNKTIKIYDFISGNEIGTLEGSTSNLSGPIAISSDWKYIASALDSTLLLWNTQNSELNIVSNAHSKWITSLVISNNNDYVISGSYDKNIRFWEIPNLSLFRELNNENKVFSLEISNDNKYLASGGLTDLKLWDIEKFDLKKTFGDTMWIENINSISFSPNNKYLLAGAGKEYTEGFDDNLFYWEIESQFLKILKFDNEWTCAYSVDIKDGGDVAITGDAMGDLIMWNLLSGKKIKTINAHNNSSVSVAKYSPSGKYIITGGGSCNGSDYSIKLWNNAGDLIRTFKGHSLQVNSIFFSSDEKFIISSSIDNSIKIWDINSGKEVVTILFLNNKNWVVATPDGRFDGSPKGIEKLHYVKGLEIIPLESFYEKYYTPNLLARILSGEKFEEPAVKIDDISLPPLVEITSPSEQGDLRGFKPVNTGGLISPSQQIEVTVQATDQGGGIDEIRLFVNGKLVETTQRGFKPVVQNNQTKSKTFTILLSNSKNIIKATAFNNQRTESIADEITLFYEGQNTTSNLYLFVIGINEYLNSQHNLNYAVADATAFKEAIETNSKTIFGSVNITFLTNEHATKDKIIETFETLKSAVKQEDVFIFYYAGHGAMSVEDNPQFYIIPHNVTQIYGNNSMLQTKAISAEELQNLSMELPAQKQLFVFDACQSGGMGDVVMRGNAEEKAIAVLARATGTYWLTASGSDQFATEFAQIGHGVFTYAILLGLQGNADGGNHDKQITVKELDAYIQDKVPELSKQYKGQMQFPKSYGGGDDFPLIIIK